MALMMLADRNSATNKADPTLPRAPPPHGADTSAASEHQTRQPGVRITAAEKINQRKYRNRNCLDRKQKSHL